MTLLNSCLVLKSLACVFVVVPSIDYSIEQVVQTSCLRLKLVELNFFASFNAQS